jgi:His-Xaa-Ser system protein HxsD
MSDNLKVLIDCNIYPLEAVKAASYTFTDKCFMEIKQLNKNKVEVILKPKKNSAILDSKLKDKFLNELLHHALRLKIAENNQEIRKFIVAKALMSAVGSSTGNKSRK